LNNNLKNNSVRHSINTTYLWMGLALLVFICSFFPHWVGSYYSSGVFQYLGWLLRTLSGFIEIPLGEWVYLFLLILLIIRFIQSLYAFKNKFKTQNFRFNFIHFFKKLLFRLLQLYVVFMLLWGLNYRKTSVAEKLHLKVDTSYSEVQLDSLSVAFIHRLNSCRQNIPDSVIQKLSYAKVFDQAIQQTRSMPQKFTLSTLNKPVLKKASFPFWGDYLGYLAFYQPITGEAIIRTDVPILTLPFTSSHELAHQMGYASETEANFIAYIIAMHSKDSIFKYSMLLQMFTYSQSAHLSMIAASGNFEKWKEVVNRNKNLLDPKVYRDRKLIKDFFNQRQHLLIPASSSLYDQFLQWNKQAKGIKSYDEVLLWVLAY